MIDSSPETRALFRSVATFARFQFVGKRFIQWLVLIAPGLHDIQFVFYQLQIVGLFPQLPFHQFEGAGGVQFSLYAEKHRACIRRELGVYMRLETGQVQLLDIFSQRQCCHPCATVRLWNFHTVDIAKCDLWVAVDDFPHFVC